MKTVTSFILKLIAILVGSFIALVVVFILLILGMAEAAQTLIN